MKSSRICYSQINTQSYWCSLFIRYLNLTSETYEITKESIFDLPGWQAEVENTFGRNKQKAMAGRKRRQDKLDKLTTNWNNNLRINIGRLYGGRIKLTDSSIYEVEIAQFQDLILQK